jgi:hypothetical protein
MKNFYQILNVSEHASLEEIKSAYRKLARIYHPDVAKTKEAEEKFKEVNRAYETLSDSLKRADYDQTLNKDTYTKTYSTTGPTGTKESRVDRSQILGALSRVSAYIVTFAFIVFILQWFIWWLAFSENIVFNLAYFSPSIIFGALLGGFWGADANFKVETFFGSGIWGRSYTFLRTIVMGLGAGYILGMFGSVIDFYLYKNIGAFSFIFFSLGMIIGSTAGSDGDTIEKIQSNRGRFNLFYTALRGMEIGAITAMVGLIIGFIMFKFGAPGLFMAWGAFFGFIIGDILGSIAPPNLAAYASYASAYVTSSLVILMILGGIILGIIIGTTVGDQIKTMFSDLFSSLANLF